MASENDGTRSHEIAVVVTDEDKTSRLFGGDGNRLRRRVVRISIGGTAKGDAGTSVRAPVLWSIWNIEISL